MVLVALAARPLAILAVTLTVTGPSGSDDRSDGPADQVANVALGSLGCCMDALTSNFVGDLPLEVYSTCTVDAVLLTAPNAPTPCSLLAVTGFVTDAMVTVGGVLSTVNWKGVAGAPVPGIRTRSL